jgi:hypothetical protein
MLLHLGSNDTAGLLLLHHFNSILPEFVWGVLSVSSETDPLRLAMQADRIFLQGAPRPCPPCATFPRIWTSMPWAMAAPAVLPLPVTVATCALSSELWSAGHEMSQALRMGTACCFGKHLWGPAAVNAVGPPQFIGDRYSFGKSLSRGYWSPSLPRSSTSQPG